MTLIMTALVLSWVAIVLLALVAMALTRQIGLLHERVAPAGALSIEKRNLRSAEAAPEFHLSTVDGSSIQIGGSHRDGRSTLLFFLSDTCPVCKILLPVLKALREEEASWLDIVLASDGDAAVHREFIRRQALERFPYLLSEPLGRAYEISKLPYGVLIDKDGTLLTHGLVNNREHLESLLEARRLGVASIQEYAARDAA
ncbi:MAG: redoxin domain-containing protein [Parahaliea sp.]